MAAATAAQDALADGAHGLAVSHAAAALALDPFDPRAASLLEQAWARSRAEGDEGPLTSARGFVTLAFADELKAEPELLAAYGRQFGAADDATLLIYAPGRSEDDAVEELMPALDAASIDPDAGPDLLVHTGAGGDADRAVIWPRLQAVLTHDERQVFTGVPRYGADAVAHLRRRAAQG
jgi:hypothetical protein